MNESSAVPDPSRIALAQVPASGKEPTPTATRRRKQTRSSRRPASSVPWIYGVQTLEKRLAWIGPLVFTVIAFGLRFVRLGHIKTLIFDETYYVKDAIGLIRRGYEVHWPDKYDSTFITGTYQVPTEGSFVVHPELGKWMIGLGIMVFGDNPWGWRIAVCLAGTFAVLLLGRITYHLFGSWQMATIAAAFLAFDGLQIAQSRTSILDMLLSFWVLVGVWALVRDQVATRRRLLIACEVADKRWPQRTKPLISVQSDPPDYPDALDNPELAATDAPALEAVEQSEDRESAPDSTEPKAEPTLTFFERITRAIGPGAGMRWWLVVAGIAFGVASGVKWSGVYVLAGAGIFVFVREVSARWRYRPAWRYGGSLVRGGLVPFLALVPTAFGVYVAGWAAWFLHPKAWGHKAGQSGLVNLWQYHVQAYDFHKGVTQSHPYKSNPFAWLVQYRPTSFFFEDVDTQACGSTRCVEAMVALGNPLLWWLGVVTLLVVGFGALRGDWRAWFILTGYLTLYVPWLLYAHRTIFTFYTVVLTPFVALSVVYALGYLAGWIQIEASQNQAVKNNLRRAPATLPWYGPAFAWTVAGLVVLVGIYFYPVWSAWPLPFEQWSNRMWLSSWI